MAGRFRWRCSPVPPGRRVRGITVCLIGRDASAAAGERLEFKVKSMGQRAKLSPRSNHFQFLTEPLPCGMAQSRNTSAANLFAAAKSNFIAANTLLVAMQGVTAASAIPFYFLSGFAIELALKAVVLRVNGNQRELRTIGHDLRAALRAAEACGLTPIDADVFNMVVRMSDSHAGLAFRYIPDVEVMDVMGPELLDRLLSRLIKQIEGEFDVWEDQPADRPKLS